MQSSTAVWKFFFTGSARKHLPMILMPRRQTEREHRLIIVFYIKHVNNIKHYFKYDLKCIENILRRNIYVWHFFTKRIFFVFSDCLFEVRIGLQTLCDATNHACKTHLLKSDFHREKFDTLNNKCENSWRVPDSAHTSYEEQEEKHISGWRRLWVKWFFLKIQQIIPVCKACCSFNKFSSCAMSLICFFSSSIAALFAESVERNAKFIPTTSCHGELFYSSSALWFCKSCQIFSLPSRVKLNSSPTFLAISSLWRGLLGRAVSQQEKAKHQANLSSIHNTWKTLQIRCKETLFWGSATISSSQLRALARLFCGTSSEWMRKSYLRENKCFTDVEQMNVCVAFEMPKGDGWWAGLWKSYQHSDKHDSVSMCL